MTATNFARYFIKGVVRLHGLSKEVICDRDPKYRANLTQTLFARLGVTLKMSTSFHPQGLGKPKGMIALKNTSLVFHQC